MNRKIGLSLAIISLITAAALAQPATTAAQTLTGTWVTTVTPPVESGVPAFKLIFTFNADGNLLATGTGGEFPALGNPCHGVWDRGARANQYDATYVCFDYDGALQFVGNDKLRARFVLDDKQRLTGRIDLTNFDPDGNLVFNACCADVAGSKLELDRLVEPTSNTFPKALPYWRH